MFYKYPYFPPGAFDDDRLEKIERIANGLAKAGIVDLKRRMIQFELPGGELVSGDIAPTGFTVYLGGFDWVTYPSPPQLLLKFPQFMPLPAASPPPPAGETPRVDAPKIPAAKAKKKKA